MFRIRPWRLPAHEKWQAHSSVFNYGWKSGSIVAHENTLIGMRKSKNTLAFIELA
jgi:hypothetical protein